MLLLGLPEDHQGRWKHSFTSPTTIYSLTTVTWTLSCYVVITTHSLIHPFTARLR